MADNTVFKAYLKELQAVAQQGDAREESFYPSLVNMLNSVAEITDRKHIHITTLPKSTDAGNPDFRVWNGTDRIVGYVEAKKPEIQKLDLIEESEQINRYRSTFPNFILTNFFEFRLYRYGDLIQSVVIARPFIFTKLRTTPVIEKAEEFQLFLDRFLDFSLPKSFTAESLAVELAKRTSFLRDVVIQEIEQEKDSLGILSGFFEAFQTFLIGTLTHRDFADLFAQTITYGLFAARTRAEGLFNRRAAFDSIPHTIGILRDLFRFISLGNLPSQLAWCVDDIAEVLAVADARGILEHYFHSGKGSDPIVHFYETFLAKYDPMERERRGVYYTPEPVVGYIVRSLHNILKTEFNKRDGLASAGVTLLDPAAGTMTFIAKAAQLAVTEFEEKYGTGGRADFICSHILKNFYAFELMMAPYAVGHLKMSFFLEELGHRLSDDERVLFYLTNTLDNEELEQSRLPGFSALAEESRLAGVVKKNTPLLVILGNPPYSGHSTNKGNWIRGLIESYKQVDNKPLGEKNPKWLQDDYVKFLRFGQWKIEQSGGGIIGMITNHSYLDNPTFRGMRQSLLRTFDEIYILDLHGNALKKETSPDGSPDKNVFDIRQGVTIAFFIKRRNVAKTDAIVHHAHLYGLTDAKYDWLNRNDWRTTDWHDLKPSSPFYLFVPQDNTLEASYRRFPSVPEIFPLNSVGIVTARDKLCIHWNQSETWKTVTVFSRMEPELARQGYNLGKDTRDWKVTLAQKDLINSGPSQENIVSILYRPFDIRFTYYTGRSRGFICMPRPEIMRHMLAGTNIALITSRLTKGENFRHVQVTENITEVICMSPKTSNNGFIFPLYLYPNSGQNDLFAFHEISDRRPNLNPLIILTLARAYGKEPTPEAIFNYIYAILYTTKYQVKYSELLSRDFPRIPFTSNFELFQNLGNIGESLINLHLLKSSELDPPTCRFEGTGDGFVSKDQKNGLRYVSSEQRIYVSASQYFTPVSEIIWNYQIGGYQVCEKWLRDRKERRLELDDIRTYCRIVTALGRTIQLQHELDYSYNQVERDIVTLML